MVQPPAAGHCQEPPAGGHCQVPPAGGHGAHPPPRQDQAATQHRHTPPWIHSLLCTLYVVYFRHQLQSGLQNDTDTIHEWMLEILCRNIYWHPLVDRLKGLKYYIFYSFFDSIIMVSHCPHRIFKEIPLPPVLTTTTIYPLHPSTQHPPFAHILQQLWAVSRLQEYLNFCLVHRLQHVWGRPKAGNNPYP